MGIAAGGFTSGERGESDGRLSAVIPLTLALTLCAWGSAVALPGEPLNAWQVFADDQPTSPLFFGQSIAAVGDIDGDGVADLAVGSRFDPPESTTIGTGSVRILFMNAEGTVRDRVELRPPAGELWGLALAPLGDLDGDGTPDLALGLPILQNINPNYLGEVSILFLEPSGGVRERHRIDHPMPSPGAARWFGLSLAWLGDLDGDGVVDLAAGGATSENDQPRNLLWLLHLRRDGSLKDWSLLSGDQEPFSSLLAQNHFFGESVASLGDLNRDGVPELAIGCSYPPRVDGVYLYDSAPGIVLITSLTDSDTVTTVTRFTNPDYDPPVIFPFHGYDGFGSAVAAAGDVDGDGVGDLVVGNPAPERVSATPGDDAGGVAWVFLLHPDGTVKAQTKLNGTTGPLNGQIETEDYFGLALAPTGNLDNMGRRELAVTAPGDDTLALNAGTVWLITLDGTPYPSLKDMVSVLLGKLELPPGLLTVFDVNQDGIVDAGDLLFLVLMAEPGA